MYVIGNAEVPRYLGCDVFNRNAREQPVQGHLARAGFTAVRHRLYWHTLLASPFLMCAMVLIAATFTLRHTRQGGGTAVIGAGVLTGFVLYFFSDIVFALGLSDSIPVTLAAWTPSGVATLLGLATLLHLEDG